MRKRLTHKGKVILSTVSGLLIALIIWFIAASCFLNYDVLSWFTTSTAYLIYGLMLFAGITGVFLWTIKKK